MISVFIMCHDGGQATADYLHAITSIVFDQQSDVEETVEVLILDRAGSFVQNDLTDVPGVKLLSCPGFSPAEARNLALRESSGWLLCFTDQECRPLDGWLAALREPFDDAAVAGVKGSYANAGESLVSRFIQLEHEVRYDRLRKLRSIDFIDMYSAAYRRQVLLANDGFDERFELLEEQELAYRLAGRGYRMVYRQGAQVRRRHPSSIATYFRRKAKIGYWKAQVIRFFPDRGMSDSYTPQRLKLQIAAFFLAAVSLILSIFQPVLLVAALIALLVFVTASLPLLAIVWTRDRPVIMVALPMLAARAVALGVGYLLGVLKRPPSLSGKASPIAGATYVTKRSLDIIGSLFGMAITLLLSPIIAIAIKLDSSGPVLFRQTRIGRGGQPFSLYKFRTMAADAEVSLDLLIDLQGLEQPAFKLIDDPRVTRVGRFLRRWSLDELPQFWNVLRSEMSLVGPRPEESRIVALYSDWHRKRLAVKPGMTGPMQVRGRGDLSLNERVELEIKYIEEYTLWRDMKILASTIPSVLRGQGAR